MLNQLKQALQKGQQGRASPQHQGEPSESQDLAQALKSQAMQQAMGMANRMRGMQRAARSRGQSNSTSSNMATTGNLQGSPPPGFPLAGKLGAMDPAARRAILKMQQKAPEKILQSSQQKGPEGYQEFIDDYFRQLSQESSPKKP
jgi:hypothetical protein